MVFWRAWPSIAEPFRTMASTSAIATRIFTAPSGIASATVSWSRSRESSLSIEAQGRLRRSRRPAGSPAAVARIPSSSASTVGEKSGSKPRSIIALRAIRLRVMRCRSASGIHSFSPVLPQEYEQIPGRVPW